MTIRDCKKDKNCEDKEGNCLTVGSDGLVVQCVGPWAEDKYYFLEKYLNATREIRRDYSDIGNAVFIDLFSGPGRCIIRDKKDEIDSGGIRALNRDEAPFNECFYIDISKTNADALKIRIGHKNNCHVWHGDSNILVNKLVDYLSKAKYDKLHFAFVDPFGPKAMKFDTLAELAKFKRMDMLIHFPIGAIKRNIDTWKAGEETILDDFLGTPDWRNALKNVPSGKILTILLDIFIKQLKSIGYPEDGLKMVSSDRSSYSQMPAISVHNTRGVNLYVLILACKHPIGQKIWNNIIKKGRGGQKEFNFN